MIVWFPLLNPDHEIVRYVQLVSPPQYEDGARDPHDIDTLWLGGGVPQVPS